jgi:outer membrane protein TolC
VIKQFPRLSRLTGILLALSFALPLLAQQRELPPPYYDYPFANATTSSRTLTMEDAVGLALGYAAAYRQTTFDERSAAEDVHQSRAALYPQLSVPITQFSTTPSVVGPPDQPRTFSFVSSSAINETSAYFNATGTVDIAGHLRAALQKNRALLAAAHAGTQAARRALVLATVDTYYALLLAQERRRLADEALSVAEGVAASSTELQAQGKAEQTEVDRARASALARRDELEQARLAEYAAATNVHTITGIDFSVHLIVQSISRREPTSTDFVDLGPQSFLARPELAQIDAQKIAARADARQARTELFPQLTYSFNAGVDTASLGRLRQYSGGGATVSLNIPVFNFGASRSRERQAGLRSQALDVQRQNLEASLRAEFFGARAGMESALQRIKYTREAASLTQKNLDAVFAGYRDGKNTLLDVNDAQSAFAAARLAYYQAIADYHSARYRLDADPLSNITAVTAAPAATTPNLSPHVSATEFAPCTDGPEAAPAIGGIRLGMTESELRGLIPRLPPPVVGAKGLGHSGVPVADLGPTVSAEPIFQGIERLDFEFYQGRLSYLRISWPVTSRWIGSSEFVSHTADQMGISGHWKAFYDWSDKEIRDEEDLRDVAVECAGYRLSMGIGIEGLGPYQTPHLELEDLTVVRALKK